MTTKKYTYKEIRELYFKTSTGSYKDRENKEPLSDDHLMEWDASYFTLCKIIREIDYCTISEKLLLLKDIHWLYHKMCEDMKVEITGVE